MVIFALILLSGLNAAHSETFSGRGRFTMGVHDTREAARLLAFEKAREQCLSRLHQSLIKSDFRGHKLPEAKKTAPYLDVFMEPVLVQEDFSDVGQYVEYTCSVEMSIKPGELFEFVRTVMDDAERSGACINYHAARRRVSREMDSLFKSMEYVKDDKRLIHFRSTRTHLVKKLSALELQRKAYGTPSPAESVRYISQALDLDSTDAESWYRRGIYYLRQQNYDPAVHDFTRAMDAEPGHYRAVCYRGMAFEKQGKIEQALMDFTWAINLNPDRARAYVLRGRIYHKNKKHEKGMLDFNRALEIEPGNVEARLNKALTLTELQLYKSALRDLNMMIAQKPSLAVSYYHRGRLYMRQGQNTKAQKDFYRYLEITEFKGEHSSDIKRIINVLNKQAGN
jgi:tetratricopeptide (TPR) repeat protein